MKNKSAEYHIRFIDPTTVICDFELAIINSVREVFPTSNLRHCFFHLGQSGYRKVQSLGLQVQRNDPEDREFKGLVHSMLSIAFVPVDDVRATFHELYQDLPRALRPLADYFETTYIG